MSNSISFLCPARCGKGAYSRSLPELPLSPWCCRVSGKGPRLFWGTHVYFPHSAALACFSYNFEWRLDLQEG